MAKKSMIARDAKRQKLVDKYLKKREYIKLLIKQKKKSFGDQIKTQTMLQKLPRNSAATRVRQRCWATGRSRGCFRFFGLSRHAFREMAHDCLIPGLKKASW